MSDNLYLELSERSKQILKGVVESYLDTGEPAGSETILKKLGAKICRNLIDLPDKCQVIIMMLANDTVSIKISKVLNKNLKKGQILIDMSSTKKKTAVKIAKKVKASKAHFLDAPVSGGTAGAKSAKLAIMEGGEKNNI